MEANKYPRTIEVVKTIDYSIGEDGYVEVGREYERIPVPWTHLKKFTNTLGIIFGLKTIARNLLDYIVEMKMDNENIVEHTLHFRNSFIDFYEKYKTTKKIYTREQVYGAFKELERVGFIHKEGKSVYKVNPLYFMNSGTKPEHRIASIEMYIKFSAEQEGKNRLKITHTLVEEGESNE